MQRREIPNLNPGDVLKRYKSAVKLVVVGPSTSGKSTLVYALVNHKIIGVISVGIGDKSQTTIIPCNFVFDVRVKNDSHFAIRVKGKKFASKLIHIELLERLATLYCQHSMDSEETYEEMTDEWFEDVLEPNNAAYHLRKIKDKIDFQQLKEILFKILVHIEGKDISLQEQINEKKKQLTNQKVPISEVRKMVFQEVWEKINPSVTADYREWLETIGVVITAKLQELIEFDKIVEMSIEQCDIFPYGELILASLFNPYEPYSLVVEEIVLSCRPRQELVEMSDKKMPLRFCFRDTMGLTQVGMDVTSIKNALDIALNDSPDSILFLLSLEERNDVLEACCRTISEKMDKANKLDIPVHVMFTKADRIIGNMINKVGKPTVELRQVDYDTNVENVVKGMETNIESFLDKIPKSSYTWVSLRYLEKDIDPIQKALESVGSGLIERFQPIGLYKHIDMIIKDTQSRILPKGMTTPIIVTVKDSTKPAVDIRVSADKLSQMIDNLQVELVANKAVVNSYLITTDYRIHGRSVVNYWGNLGLGLGYTTHAKVYGNFSINMKAMLNRQLNLHIPDLMSLYESQLIETICENMDDSELYYLIQNLDESKCEEMAFCDINPTLIKQWSDADRYTQILHLVFRHYFAQTGKYPMIIDKVAYRLSFANEYIRNCLEEIYYAPISYDETIREMQEKFKEIFASHKFMNLLADEIGAAMSELVNKMFLTI